MQIIVNNKVAIGDGTVIVCDNSGYVAEFLFDEEWDAYEVKTARFVFGRYYEEVPFTGNRCEVPVIRNAQFVAVGVFAGNLTTTTAATFRCIGSILSNAPIHNPPSEDVYNQLIELINSMPGADKEEIEKVVREYLDENPVELPVAKSDVLGGIKVGKNLTATKEGTLSVDSTERMEINNEKPITSAGVYAVVGNIEVLLKDI
nr:MAG TPA: copper resistance protein [Caudoviricetes sp.]